MNSNVDRMISNLTPAIEQKCAELQTARKERLQSRLFVLLCAMVVLIPALLFFCGCFTYSFNRSACFYGVERTAAASGAALRQGRK